VGRARDSGGRSSGDQAIDRQKEHKRIRTATPRAARDLYDSYQGSDLALSDELNADGVAAYRLSHYDTPMRPLARFALDHLAVSPMADECERLFSLAGYNIGTRRARLKADIIEVCECLRSWVTVEADDGAPDGATDDRDGMYET